jgi:2-oxoisovalerate dehydrogenase E1 component
MPLDYTGNYLLRLDMVKRAILIRKFEEVLLQLFSEGKLNGTVHTCIGQEWSAVALAQHINPGDTVFSNHRCHGHFLALHPDVEGLLAEIMGKESGLCKGLGGSQHIYYEDVFFSNGIQGGMVPISAGRALANKLKKNNNICAIFIGDGTLGEGVLYEALNFMSIHNLPMLVIVENNGYAQSTKTREVIAGDIGERAAAFGIKYLRGNTWKWQELIDLVGEGVSYVRNAQRPVVCEVETYRLKAHSKGDDNRDVNEVESYLEKDPLHQMLQTGNIYLVNYANEIERQLLTLAEELHKRDVILVPEKGESCHRKTLWLPMHFEEERIAHILNKTFKCNLQKNSKVIFIGEDILSPYGGAFKITKGLSDLAPERVIGTSISEQSIVGIGTGLAISGFIPVVEIMFGDFLTLAFDQLLNHACKFSFMYAGKVKVPLIIRTPMGGKRGYGPTHSQSIEKHFLGIPDLKVIALNHRVSPKLIYDNIFANISGPTLVIENKVLYTQILSNKVSEGYQMLFSDDLYPTIKIAPKDHKPQITIVCYGEVLFDIESLLGSIFMEDEILVEIISPSLISPVDVQPIMDSLSRTGNLLIVEEGISSHGWGAEVIAQLAENGARPKQFKRLGAKSYIPSSKPLEKHILPNTETIKAAIRTFML